MIHNMRVFIVSLLLLAAFLPARSEAVIYYHRHYRDHKKNLAIQAASSLEIAHEFLEATHKTNGTYPKDGVLLVNRRIENCDEEGHLIFIHTIKRLGTYILTCGNSSINYAWPEPVHFGPYPKSKL